MVYRNERALLERSGHQVIPFERFNDDIDDSSLEKRAKLALSAIRSQRTLQELEAIILRERPDVAHFHNTFPQISPSAYHACHRHFVPVVQTLHNFRVVCPQAMLMRRGKPCERCLGGSLLPALRHRCYRHSFAATLAQVLTITLNRRWGSYSLVNRYLALTRFAADRFVAGGIPVGSMAVKPNVLPDPPPVGKGDGGYALFAGRLSPEKGVRTLLDVWKEKPGLPLKVFGSGPLEEDLKTSACRTGMIVEFHGYCNRQELFTEIGRAEFVVVPSECYEGFPMVVLEAMACGTPVVASRLGSLDEVVIEGITGVKFTPGDPRDLAAVVTELRHDRSRLAEMRKRCRLHFEQHYSEARAVATLTKVYREVCHERNWSRSKS